MEILRENLSFSSIKEDIDVDEALYSGGFISDSDLNLAKHWLNLKTDEKIDQIPSFKDQRFSKLAYRYLCRNHFEYLSENERKEWKEYCRKKLFFSPDYSKNKLTLLENEINYQPQDDQRTKKIKNELKTFIEDLKKDLNI